MKVQTTRRFDKDYADLPELMQGRVDGQLARLMSNPGHPSLRLKRMQGTRDIWEMRITGSHRITLQIAGDLAILRRVGSHDVLDEP